MGMLRWGRRVLYEQRRVPQELPLTRVYMWATKSINSPGTWFEKHVRQVRNALARALHREGVGCIRCNGHLFHEEVPFEVTTEQKNHPWDAKVHGPWLEALDRARATQGLCKFCTEVRKYQKGDYDGIMDSAYGVDIAQKKALHTELFRELGGVCSICKREPDPDYPKIGFHFNHRESRWHGDTKKMNVSDFWVNWNKLQRNISVPSEGNRRFLDMTLEEAEPLMRAETLKCDVVCCTCHERITQGQRTDAKGTVYEWETIRAWIADRIRTCKVKCGRCKTIRIRL